MNGEIAEIDTASILIALKIKNESKDEIHGAAKIMREKSMKNYFTFKCYRYMWDWRRYERNPKYFYKCSINLQQVQVLLLQNMEIAQLEPDLG